MAAKTGKCPRCEVKFPSTRMGLIKLMNHWAKLQRQGDPAHIDEKE